MTNLQQENLPIADGGDRMQQMMSDWREAPQVQQHIASAAELFEGEVTIRALISALAEGLLVVDSDQRIVLVNQRLEEMLGYPASSLVGRPLDSVLPDRFAGIHQRHVQAYFQEPYLRAMGQGLELVARRQNGAEFPVEISLSYLDTAVGRFGLALVTDMTRRKQAEQALLEKNVALNTFAQTVAHDLLSLVSTLVGLSEYLAEGSHHVPQSDLQEYLTTIARSGRKMDNIINELLLLSSLRQDEVILSPVEMVPVVETALFRLHETIKAEQVKIIQPDNFPAALGYAPWIEEVWFNYLSNAIKYGGRPPHVEIGSTLTDDGYVRFWVKDNGVGVAADRRDQIFMSGQRLEYYPAKGHGLGLSIVQQIVHRLSGQVSLESAEGQGSIFSFSLLQAQ